MTNTAPSPIRRIKLKAHYKTVQPLVIQFTKSSSEKKSNSKETHLTVDTFVEAFKKDLEIEEKVIKVMLYNTTSQRDNIIIKQKQTKKEQ